MSTSVKSRRHAIARRAHLRLRLYMSIENLLNQNYEASSGHTPGHT
jgi:hypothetical protein